MKKLSLLMVLAASSVAAFGQTQQQQGALGIELGVTAGYYLPSGTVLKNAMGSQILSFGVSPVSFGRPTNGSLMPSVSVVGADKNGSNFLLVPVTLGYEYNFGDNSNSTVPYIRLAAGGAYMNYSIEEPSHTVSGSSVGLTASAEIGVEFSRTLRLSAIYYVFTEEQGINFSGLQIGLTLGVLRL